MMYGAITDKGMVRAENEDCYKIIHHSETLPWVFIVADGMGGHKSGEIASSMAVEYLSKHINENEAKFNDVACLPEEIISAISGTNSYIYSKASQQEDFNGMGTTLTLAIIKNDNLVIGHVGDSRLYIIQNGEMKKITEDHSYIEEMLKNGSITKEQAINHPRKNVITRAVGGDETIEVDVYTYKMENACFLVICTDGLTNMLNESEILDVVITKQYPQTICEHLVERANKVGGQDNITVIVVRFEDKQHVMEGGSDGR